MRKTGTVLAILFWGGIACGQDLNTRYNIEYDRFAFGQSGPKEALAAVVKAIHEQKIDYLLAHLSDPAWVDQRVREVHGGKFAELVKETSTKLTNDPDALKNLKRFAAEATWVTTETTATGTLKDVKDKVFMVKLRDRWFLENRKKEKTEKEKEKEQEKEKENK